MKIKRTIRSLLKTVDNILRIRAWLFEDLQAPSEFDLHGEKELDWSWVVANVPQRSSRILDVGCVGSPISPILASMGHEVIGIDLRADISYTLEGFMFIQGDFNQIDLGGMLFDVVILCSTVEHIGLSGRYGNRDDPEGDIKAMQKVRNILKSGGICILTVPVGLDGVYSPWHRVYGQKRLPRLLQGFSVIKSRYFVKRPRAYWYQTTANEALNCPSSASFYALGQFVLKREGDV